MYPSDFSFSNFGIVWMFLGIRNPSPRSPEGFTTVVPNTATVPSSCATLRPPKRKAAKNTSKRNRLRRMVCTKDRKIQSIPLKRQLKGKLDHPRRLARLDNGLCAGRCDGRAACLAEGSGNNTGRA